MFRYAIETLEQEKAELMSRIASATKRADANKFPSDMQQIILDSIHRYEVQLDSINNSITVLRESQINIERDEEQ